MCCSAFNSSEISPEGSLLASYEVAGEGREVVAFSGSDGISLHDRPASGEGEAIYIDRGYFWTDGLKSLVTEYVLHAVQIDAVPCGKGGFSAIVDPPDPMVVYERIRGAVVMLGA